MENVEGKIEIINHPIVKGKNGRSPLSGLKWKYENGIMISQWMIGGRKVINLPIAAESIEVSNEAFSLLGSLKKSNEFTPEYMLAGAASPALMMLFQQKKFENLRTKKVLIEVRFKDGYELPITSRFFTWTSGFMGFTTLEVFAHAHDLIQEACSTSN